VGEDFQQCDGFVLPVITTTQSNWGKLLPGFPAKGRAPDIGCSTLVVPPFHGHSEVAIPGWFSKGLQRSLAAANRLG